MADICVQFVAVKFYFLLRKTATGTYEILKTAIKDHIMEKP
jgi:hypothetical protein